MLFLVFAFPNESLVSDCLQLFYDRAPKTADNFRALCTGNVWCNVIVIWLMSHDTALSFLLRLGVLTVTLFN